MSNELPFESSAPKALTVSQVTALIKETFEKQFCNLCVSGEISECTRAASGHVYLTLKDEGAVLRAIIWRSLASRVRFDVEEGLEVVVRGDIDVYAPRGSYQLIISDIQPKGLGALQLAFHQLVEKLEKEGLFAPEHKKPLPRFPRRIGIVTSPTGAAIRDMIRVLSRRWPLARVYLLPRRVQGEGAAEEIAGAIHLLNAKRPDLDLIIVGRGGGSLEDLWAFNEEVVARAIFASDIPVVSAVGHETDVSISDFVADLRAATPTEAAENVAPDRAEVASNLAHLKRRLALALVGMVGRGQERLAALARRHVLRHPETLLRDRAQTADELLDRMRRWSEHRLEILAERLRALGGALQALSPLQVLERGYSITTDPRGAVLASAEGLEAGDEIVTRLLRGEVASSVTEIRPIPSDADPKEKGDA